MASLLSKVPSLSCALCPSSTTVLTLSRCRSLLPSLVPSFLAAIARSLHPVRLTCTLFPHPCPSVLPSFPPSLPRSLPPSFPVFRRSFFSRRQQRQRLGASHRQAPTRGPGAAAGSDQVHPQGAAVALQGLQKRENLLSTDWKC